MHSYLCDLGGKATWLWRVDGHFNSSDVWMVGTFCNSHFVWFLHFHRMHLSWKWFACKMQRIFCLPVGMVHKLNQYSLPSWSKKWNTELLNCVTTGFDILGQWKDFCIPDLPLPDSRVKVLWTLMVWRCLVVPVITIPDQMHNLCINANLLLIFKIYKSDYLPH